MCTTLLFSRYLHKKAIEEKCIRRKLGEVFSEKKTLIFVLEESDKQNMSLFKLIV